MKTIAIAAVVLATFAGSVASARPFHHHRPVCTFHHHHRICR
jgi:hypothetical protein